MKPAEIIEYSLAFLYVSLYVFVTACLIGLAITAIRAMLEDWK